MTEGPAVLDRPGGRAGELAERAWRAAVLAWERIPLREPWRVLGPLLAVHWLALAAFVRSVHHDGWLFYQGGDQIWYWTTSWLLAHGSIPIPRVSYGWPLVELPFTWATGASYLSGLPGLVILQVVVLAPIALYCVYDLAARIGGRAVGYLAALVWTVAPYAAIPLFVQRYHDKYVDQFLPHALGLTAMADYPGMVLLLAGAALALRAYQSRHPSVAMLAGLVAGLSCGIKPSNLIWPPLMAAVFLGARRWRELIGFGAGLAPAIGTLTLWKYQGFGYVPAFAYEQARLALGSDTLLAPYHRYVNIDWHQLDVNKAQLAEVFFSVRVLEIAPVAGAIAVARRSWGAALSLSLWYWAIVIVKGASDTASVENGSFFRFVMPAAPALIVLLAALPLLVPRGGVALARRLPAPAARPVPKRALVAAVFALGLVPVVAAAAVSPLGPGGDRTIQVASISVPVVGQLHLRAQVHGRVVQLRWASAGSASARVFYRLYRANGPYDLTCKQVHAGAAHECHEAGDIIGSGRGLVLRDRPGSGVWTYRIGVAANYLNDASLGDVFLASRPVTVRVG
jgi:hypothetical protein